MGAELVFVDEAMRRSFAAVGLRSMEDLLRLESGQIIRQRATLTLRRLTLDLDSRQENVYLKVYDYSRMSFWRRLCSEKASREARNYLAMRECGVDVPDLIAYGERRRLGMFEQGLLMTREVQNCVGLEEWFERQGRVNPIARRYLLGASARMVSRMHERGFFHIDLQWRNILVTSPDDRNPGLVLIDSARGGTRSSSAAREYGRVRDLSSLYKDARRSLSWTEIIRWLREYFDVPRLGQRQKQLIWTILRDRGAKDNPRE